MKSPSMVQRVRGYLAQRRALGFRLRSEGYLLLNFARYADRHGSSLTNKLAITWARLPKAGNRPRWARRLEAVRRLAKYLAATDPRTELPPRHLFGPSKQPYQPFLYSPKQIAHLLTAAGQLPGELRPCTYQTLIGLLACTGLRVSEALHLKVPEVDLQQGLLLVREGKFCQTRWVPLDPTAFRPLRLYHQQRQKRFPLAEHFFASESGSALRYGTVHAVFSRLRRTIACAGRPPRIHDLRHTHACRVLQRWQASRQGVDSRALILSRYLGHRHVRDTYWYLHAVPELMVGAGERFEPNEHEKP
jgi:integrase/recombinase XerD